MDTIPGAYTSDSDSDSQVSLSAEAMEALEELAALDTEDDDQDFEPSDGMGEDEPDLIVDDDDDDLELDPQDDEDEEGDGADNGRGGAPLQIGVDPSTGFVFTVGPNGDARRLTAADLRGTSLTLGTIRGMLQRRFGTAIRLGDDDEDEEGDEDEEMESDDDEGDDWWGPTRRNAKQYYDIPKEPQENGMRLEQSGAFGPPPRKYSTSKRLSWTSPLSIAEQFRLREWDIRAPKRSAMGDIIPNSAGVEVAQFTSKVYSGQYSSDGRFFYSACQDFHVYIFDTSLPPRVGTKSVTDTGAPRSSTPYRHDWEMRTSLPVRKTVTADPNNCRWTLTDAELSDDNEWLVYSSISPRAHLVKTGGSGGGAWAGGDDQEQETLDFAQGSDVYGGFGIWSLRFSHDAREVIAGASSGSIFVYDIAAQRTSLRISAHKDDVNAVAFGSASDNNLLLSGSDDSFVKVWDRRSLEGGRCSGVLVGHTEGITYVSAKGDGRYVLSNGKDQAAKLWDLRMMTSDADFDRQRLDRKFYGIEGWDYRQSFYAKPRFKQHPHDTSVMTYRGHAVLRTLIRAHFSPLATTSQRYIYSGSSDGCIRIWSLDGRTVSVLDRTHTHPLMNGKSGEYNDPSSIELRRGRRKAQRGNMSSTVRDVSWHPESPVMMSTAWEGRGSVEGSIAVHEWAGRKGEVLEDQVERAKWEAKG
ncbi:hypothetical protein JCM11641_007379 [Rhodosporidiobolus odoratus]